MKNVTIPSQFLQELLALCGPEDHELRERVLKSAAPAHPAEGVPPQASEWDGKLPERLQSVLNALRLELPAAVVNDVEFEVRSHYEAMHTSLSTSRRMYGAARDRLEAIDAAQPDPFAATQPAAQGMDAQTAYEAECFRWLRDKALDVWEKGPVVFMTDADGCPGSGGELTNNILTGKKLEQAIPVAAQAKQGGAANG